MKRVLLMVMIMAMQFSVLAVAYADSLPLPEGTVEVKDPETGEIRYRLNDEAPDDPRTYTYEEVVQDQSEIATGWVEGDDDPDTDHMTIDNIDIMDRYSSNNYGAAGLKTFLSNYLYYFNQDDDACYHAHIIEDSFKDSSKYDGIVTFNVAVDEYPDMVVSCEYSDKYRCFGFNSPVGDMSLKAQLAITNRGYHISKDTLKAYASGSLNWLLPQSGNKKRTAVDKVYILSVSVNGRELKPDRYFYLEDDADLSLINNKMYTKSNVNNMLLLMREKSRGTVRYTDCLPELWEFYRQSQVDVAGILAIAESEGIYENPGNAKHWNFFNCKTPKGGTSINGTGLWDAKADCETMGEAMVMQLQSIYRNYLIKGQDSFYKMSFGGYGYPKTREEAESAEITHSYRPWFFDKGYMVSGFDDYYAWCNKCSRLREELVNASD